MDKPVDHQFGLFGHIPPSGKVPISKERIEEAKKLYYNGKVKGAVQILREVNDSLDRYLNRISNNPGPSSRSPKRPKH